MDILKELESVPSKIASLFSSAPAVAPAPPAGSVSHASTEDTIWIDSDGTWVAGYIDSNGSFVGLENVYKPNLGSLGLVGHAYTMGARDAAGMMVLGVDLGVRYPVESAIWLDANGNWFAGYVNHKGNFVTLEGVYNPNPASIGYPGHAYLMGTRGADGMLNLGADLGVKTAGGAGDASPVVVDLSQAQIGVSNGTLAAIGVGSVLALGLAAWALGKANEPKGAMSSYGLSPDEEAQYSEFMKLPRRELVQACEYSGVRPPRGYTLDTCSKDDLARGLACKVVEQHYP